MAGTQLQGYRYSSKVAGAADTPAAPFSVAGIFPDTNWYPPHLLGMELVNPEDLLTVEGLVTHFRAEPALAGTKVTGISIYSDDADIYARKKSGTWVDLDIAMDGDGIIDFTKSLGGLINKTGRNIVVISLNQFTTMDIIMWKNDMLYTVLGVK